MNIDLLASAYEKIGFPFYALCLGDIVTFLSHPRAHEGSHYLVPINGVLPERREAVATAFGRILQQVSVTPECTQNIATSQLISQVPALRQTLLDLTSDPNPRYQMSVLPERLYWEEISPWPAAFSSFFGQLGELIQVYALLIKRQREELPFVSILDQTSRTLPTRFHYAAASLGAWGGGTLNLQFLAFGTVSPCLVDSAKNEAVAKGLGFDSSTAKCLSDSGLVSVSAESIRAVFDAQGDDTAFGGTPIDEVNTANMPADMSLPTGGDLGIQIGDGYIIDKYYRSTFRAREPGRQALYGARSILRDHYTGFYSNVSVDGLIRCKHFCAPVIEVHEPTEMASIVGTIPIHSKDGVFFRGQTSLYALPRHERVKTMLFGDSVSLEPSLSTSAARRNFDYDQLHFALKYHIQDQVILRPEASERLEKRMQRWRSMSHSPLCELDYAIMALGQHYGLPTHGLDVTSSMDIAIWFATNVWHNSGGVASYRKLTRDEWADDPGSWPVVFACQQITHSLGKSLQRCEDLSEFGLTAERPLRQKASFFHGGHSDHQNRLAETVICAFRLAPGEWLTSATYEELFPQPKDDLAYRIMLSFSAEPAYQRFGANEVARYSYSVP